MVAADVRRLQLLATGRKSEPPDVGCYYGDGADAACSVAANEFVPVLTHTTSPLAVGFGIVGKFNQPITTSLPLLNER